MVELTAAKPIGDVELAAPFGALRRLRYRGASVAIGGPEPRPRDGLDAAALEGLAFTTTVRDALRAPQPGALHPGGPSPLPPCLSRRRTAHLSMAEASLAREEKL